MRWSFCLIILLSLFSLSQEKYEKVEIIQKEILKIPFGDEIWAPALSPSGKFISFTTQNFKGLYLYDLEEKKVIELTNLDGAGFGYEWQKKNDLVAFRASVGDRRKKHYICVAHTDGIKEVASPMLDTISLPVWIEDNLVFAVFNKNSKVHITGREKEFLKDEKFVFPEPDGNLILFKGEKKEKINENKIFFLIRYSSDGEKFLVHSIDDSIYIGFRKDGTLKKIGFGSNARFGKNDSVIIYEKTKDDGHKITGSDLYLYEIETEKTYRLTETEDVIERMPYLSDDGMILWCENGKVVMGWLK